MTQDITSLIEKLEGAEVGSRELDFRIWLALERDNTVVPQIPASFQSKRGDEFELYDADERCTGWVGFHVVPHYSQSLDAALALAERVLPGWVWNMGNDLPCWVHLWIDDRNYDGNPIKGDAATPALALCAAILRAQSEAH